MSILKEWWGPKFWAVLHTLAECSGYIQSPVISNDEADAWTILLKSQPFVMPCSLCKNHFLEFKTSRRIPNIRLLQGEARRGFLREWLWSCHSNVNMTTQKENIPLEELPNLYAKNNQTNNINVLYGDINQMFAIALERSLLKSEDIKRWKGVVTRLRMLYGV